MADDPKDGAKGAAGAGEKPVDKKDAQIAQLKDQLRDAKSVADDYAAEVAQLQGQIDALAEPPVPPIRVRAKRTGWYNQTRLRPGAEFTIPDMKDFGKSWMELIDEPAAPAPAAE